MATLSDGTKRYYERQDHDKGSKCKSFKLVLEVLPNGLRRHYSYTGKKSILEKIWTCNRDESLVLNTLTFDHKSHKRHYTARGSDGRAVTYERKRKELKSRYGKYIASEYVEVLEAVSAEHLPRTTYKFKNELDYKNGLKVEKVSYPAGRCLEVEYNGRGQVKRLKAPVGKGATPLTAYTFKYGGNYTEVRDALENLTTYRFKDNRLVEKNEAGIRSHKYFWSTAGKLLASSLVDPDGKARLATVFTYDAMGNVLEKHFMAILAAGRLKRSA